MKVAVVGLGYWGPNLVRNLAATGRAKLIVCDQDPARIDRMNYLVPGIESTQDFDVVLADDAVDAVVLATPISSHGALGLRVLEADKHLFVEKPLAGSALEARALIAKAADRKRVLMVGHTFEYSPPVLVTKEIIDRGELGKIYFISSYRVNLGLHQRDASVVWDLAPHDLSILMHWLDEKPSRVTAVGRDCVRAGQPDVAFVNLEFGSGVIASVEVAWLAPSKLRRTAVVGEKKMLVYDDTEHIEKVKIYDQGVSVADPTTFGEYQLTYRTGDIVSPRLPSTEPLRTEMEHFLDCVATGENPRTDGACGLRVVEALEAADKSIRERRPVDIPSDPQ